MKRSLCCVQMLEDRTVDGMICSHNHKLNSLCTLPPAYVLLISFTDLLPPAGLLHSGFLSVPIAVLPISFLVYSLQFSSFSLFCIAPFLWSPSSLSVSFFLSAFLSPTLPHRLLSYNLSLLIPTGLFFQFSPLLLPDPPVLLKEVTFMSVPDSFGSLSSFKMCDCFAILLFFCCCCCCL